MEHPEGTSRHLSAEEFAVLPEVDAREELVRGDVVREPLPAFGHGLAAVRIGTILDTWVHRPSPDPNLGQGSGQIGEGRRGWVVDHCGFVLARDPDTVRGPDVAYVSSERLATGVTDGPFFEGAPDLAVEILSSSNRPREIAEKIGEYLEAGARRVWVVDQERKTVTVHGPDRTPRTLGSGDVLDGEEVLPGFSVPVSELFG